MSNYLQKLCVYQLKEMYGKCSTIRLVDIDKDVPTLPDMWDYDFTVYVFHSSLRPIGVNLRQIHVDINAAWPYNLKDYAIDYNPLDVKDKDLRHKFIAYSNGIDNTVPMYIYLTSNNSFYFSLSSKIPDGMVRAFNPGVFVMAEPFSNFKCVDGVAMPSKEDTGSDVFEVLQTCKFQTFTPPPPMVQAPPMMSQKAITEEKETIKNTVFTVVLVFALALSFVIYKSN
jgi:hypothetical protein